MQTYEPGTTPCVLLCLLPQVSETLGSMASATRKVIFAALIGNSLVAITKFVAATLTGSSAMLSEGIHSLVDTGNQGLILYGLKRAQQPPDARFPFGHGKEVYFWSFIVAILIFAVGAGISIYEGIHQLMNPHPISDPLINYGVLLLAMIFEGVAWTLAFREFNKARGQWAFFEAVRRGKDPTIFVVLFEDSAAMLGLIIAFLGIGLVDITGILYFDGIASILIGMVLAGTAAWLAYETQGLLIGESASRGVVDGIRQVVSDFSEVRHINELLTMHMGPDFILVNLAVNFSDDATADDLEDIITRIEQRIKRSYPQVKRIFIEAEKTRKEERSTLPG